jgi:hypothetical protein
MVIGRFGIGRRGLRVGANERAALPWRQVATMTCLVGNECVAVRPQAVLLGGEEVVIRFGSAHDCDKGSGDDE